MNSAIDSILTPERTVKSAPLSSKKKVLEYLGSFIADHISESSADEIYERLLNRERMGSTGIGEGIAIPHCRLKQCDKTFGVLLQLETPIDFDAIDRQPVDLIFALLVPEEATDEHLKTLSMLAQKLSQADYRDALRNSTDSQNLYQRAIS
ncbi:MAG: PTS IIA-like nitrogen regulatory protein PtsN [Oleispira antarctica]|uniref:Phosphoenolpyruvate-dependent sugar phosphotransferase system (PTS), subunit EIIA 2 n=1 Tax=Oleispira antarctica RB-8 TaxID=698738 RepID=R4YJZ1_OLEAN|nr:PTS IIA-like nitrogen regulatory protein PtsN [Oleispira antarctica]MBQ0791096.1 PTS IIA-like nitrogen regulatory protein PtsN [Oleispira antarctica]CCK74617.1 Phosphoenolpyruvate-dependent sugar phosphotransferase system (PTS), subunit EIIA 2 [Oleispira antarctica RB-8]